MAIHALINKAIALLEVEAKIIYLEIQHPQIVVCNESHYTSPLHWSKEFTQTDLIELLNALHKLGVILNRNGSPADFNAIVREFERLFNIKIKNDRKLRTGTVSRKIHPSKFLDRLRSAFIHQKLL